MLRPHFSKTIATILLLFNASTHAEPQDMPTDIAQKESLFLLSVDGIKQDRGGELVVFIFFAEGFPKQHDQAIQKTVFPVSAEQMKIRVTAPTKQPFAIKVLHDENRDGKVTKNWTGILPRDGLGFSNGARILFGVPSFEDASINFTPDMTPVIKLQYF